MESPSSSIVASWFAGYIRGPTPYPKIVSWDMSLKDSIKLPAAREEVFNAHLAFILCPEDEEVIVIKDRSHSVLVGAVPISDFHWKHLEEMILVHITHHGAHIHYHGDADRQVLVGLDWAEEDAGGEDWYHEATIEENL
jgi:hypothetical protein